MSISLKNLQKGLLDSYPDLEIIRRRSKTYSDIGRFCILLGFVCYIILLVYFGQLMTGFGWIFLGFCGLIVYIFIVHYLTIKRLDFKKYFDSIKAGYINQLLKRIDASFEYREDSISIEKVIGTGLFNKKWATATTLQGEDYFEGNYKGIQIAMSEVDFGYGNIRKVDGTFKKSLLVIMDFNKTVTSETYIYDRQFLQDENNAQIMRSKPSGTDVILENPEFEASFRTFSSDEIEGRYILTHAFMERMLELKQLLEKSGFYMSFRNSRVSLLISGKLLFEPNLNMSLSDDQVFSRFEKEIKALLKIVDVLQLNKRIWK
jgi:Protein of unknown function (DUF3137)